MADRSPVVITGMGIVSPIGFGPRQFWSALCDGGSGIRPIEQWPVPAGEPRLAAQVPAFPAREFIASAHLRRMDRLSRMIVSASRMALDDAHAVLSRVPPDRLGVVVGSALGAVSESAHFLERVYTKGPAAASPMVFPNLVLNAPASYVAMELGATGVNLTVSQGETAGEQALITAHDVIRRGRADMVLAGGGDEFAAIVYQVARRARVLSGQRGGSEWSSPYDAERNGVLLGEGAAMLVLESAAYARARGARVLAEIEACATFALPARRYEWPTDAAAAVAPLRRVVGTGGVDLICGAANSSRALDAWEMDLFGRVMRGREDDVRLTSIKGAVGEFGAAGALSAAAAVLALREQVVPPLCHLRQADARASLRLAGPRGEAHPLRRVLLAAASRGGAGAALVLRHPT